MNRRPKETVVVAYPDVQVLDVTGPHEVFSIANRLAGRPLYSLRLVSPGGAPIIASSGLRLSADLGYDDIRGTVDTVVVAGGAGSREAVSDRRLIRWLARVGRRARRVTSVCTGAFLLAEARLLDGRRATTHWASCSRLARAYPRVTVERDPIYVRDGNVWTSAGVTAGMDLALALVEEDHGRDLALGIARQLVLFLRRPGGQSQFSIHLTTRPADRQPVRELQEWMPENLAADLSVEALASRAAMSPRNFARVFRRETGQTPARFVESLRVEAARQALEQTEMGVDAVAADCGFGTSETMRRAFVRTLGVPPGAYRNRFRAA